MGHIPYSDMQFILMGISNRCDQIARRDVLEIALEDPTAEKRVHTRWGACESGLFEEHTIEPTDEGITITVVGIGDRSR